MIIGDVECFGGDCYALAFGVPAALMVIALGKEIGMTVNHWQCYHLSFCKTVLIEW